MIGARFVLLYGALYNRGIFKMSMQDTLADMFTRIRNAQQAGHTNVSMPSSKIKKSVAPGGPQVAF